MFSHIYIGIIFSICLPDDITLVIVRIKAIRDLPLLFDNGCNLDLGFARQQQR